MITTAERLQRLRHQTTSGEARRIREGALLAQEDLASVVGVDTTTVSRWERGVTLPRGEAALKYAALLDRLQKQSRAAA